MEDYKLIVSKPIFIGEIKARVKSLGEIESNMKEVKEYVEALNDYYKNIEFTEETIKDAKEEKAKINKFKAEVTNYRKNIVAEYNKPIKIFDNTAKETEKLLTDTYSIINNQVSEFENKQKREKEQEIRDYFEEYKTANDIDFVTFEQANINVTLTASKKSLKEQAKKFIDEIVDDLKLVETQDCKEEILVEYKQTLNISRAIQDVANRHKLLEEEKKRQEEKLKELEEVSKLANANIPNELPNTAQEILTKPTVEKKQEEILTLNFKVRATRSKLKELKKFLEDGGYDYE